MHEVRKHPAFDAWIGNLKDSHTRLRLLRRLEKLSKGLWGDVEPVGEGVSELREHFGPGWRMYCCQRGQVIVVMLCGGDKSSQTADIKRAKELAALLEDEPHDPKNQSR